MIGLRDFTVKNIVDVFSTLSWIRKKSYEGDSALSGQRNEKLRMSQDQGTRDDDGIRIMVLGNEFVLHLSWPDISGS